MNKKFELFLNTIHYCLWLGDRKFGDFMGKVVNVLLSPIPKYLFTKEYKKKYDERLPKEQKNHDKFFMTKKQDIISVGPTIGLVISIPVILYSCHLFYWES